MPPLITESVNIDRRPVASIDDTRSKSGDYPPPSGVFKRSSQPERVNTVDVYGAPSLPVHQVTEQRHARSLDVNAGRVDAFNTAQARHFEPLAGTSPAQQQFTQSYPSQSGPSQAQGVYSANSLSSQIRYSSTQDMPRQSLAGTPSSVQQQQQQAHSWNSTPPFLAHVIGQSGDAYSSTSPSQGASPPYEQFSASLVSTLPHTQQYMMSGGQGTTSGTSANSGNAMALVERKQQYILRKASNLNLTPSYLTSYAQYLNIATTPSSAMNISIQGSSSSNSGSPGNIVATRASVGAGGVGAGAGTGTGTGTGIALPGSNDPANNIVIVLQELEELKMRLGFANASFVPINLLAQHFPAAAAPNAISSNVEPGQGQGAADRSAFVYTTAAALQDLTVMIAAGNQGGNLINTDQLHQEGKLDAVLHWEQERKYSDLYPDSELSYSETNREEEVERLSEEFGAVGMMDEDMPFACPVPPEGQGRDYPSPRERSRSSIGSIMMMDGGLLTTFLPVSRTAC